MSWRRGFAGVRCHVCTCDLDGALAWFGERTPFAWCRACAETRLRLTPPADVSDTPAPAPPLTVSDDQPSLFGDGGLGRGQAVRDARRYLAQLRAGMQRKGR